MSRLTDARGELERYEQTKPADYQSKYQGQINDVMSKLNDLGECEVFVCGFRLGAMIMLEVLDGSDKWGEFEE